jgi:hypothetical protein
MNNAVISGGLRCMLLGLQVFGFKYEHQMNNIEGLWLLLLNYPCRSFAMLKIMFVVGLDHYKFKTMFGLINMVIKAWKKYIFKIFLIEKYYTL